MHDQQTRWWRRRLPTRLLGAAVVGTTLVMATACGGGAGGSGGVATLGEEPDGSDARGARTDQGEESFEEALLAFARCMREQGIDMPDPEPGGRGGGMVLIGPGSPADGADGDFAAAEKECGHLMEGLEPDLSPGERDRMQDEMLAFARCMRERGIDVPDPEPGGGMRMAIGEGGVDPRDPEFQAAEKACRPEGAGVEMPAPGGAVRS